MQSNKNKVLEKTLEQIYSYELESLPIRLDKEEDNKDKLLIKINKLISHLQLIDITNSYKEFIEIFSTLRISFLKIYSLNNKYEQIIKSAAFKSLELIETYVKQNNSSINTVVIIQSLLKNEFGLLTNTNKEEDLVTLEVLYLTNISITVFNIKEKEITKIFEGFEND